MEKVSVILPVYNCERYIGESIESIISQTHRPHEIIVINDGSTDNTENIVKSYKQVHLINQKNAGVSAALNKGLELANGNFIAFLDSDDLWENKKLENQLQRLNEDKKLDMVFSKVRQFISSDLSPEDQKRYECPEKPMDGIHRSALVGRSESIKRVGTFSSDYTSEEFLDWFVRAKELGLKYSIMDQVFVMRRIHGNNLTLQKERKEKVDFPKILKLALDRRRQAGENN